MRTELLWLYAVFAHRFANNPRRRFHVYRGAALLYTAGSL